MTTMMYTLMLCILCVLNISANSMEEDRYVQLIEDGMQLALTYKLPKDAREYESRDFVPTNYGTYDFIIVGCGASGAVLAAKLGAVRKWKILVLEAGGLEDDFIDVPGMEPFTLGTKYNWNFNTVPQEKSCLGREQRRCGGPRGKGFGGSTLINCAVYSRGNRHDFDNLVAAGNNLWDYNTALRYYKRQENANITGDAGYHGSNGPLDVNPVYQITPQAQAFIEANKEIGIKEIDYNGANSLGISRMQFSTRQGRRLSSYRAFLTSGLNGNIHLLSNSYVIKIEFCGRRAQSVIFTRNRKLYRAFASKEIIISAGSYQTPQLLMLSGVGPKGHLRDMGIATIKDLPVGNSLRDHPATFAINYQTNLTYNVKTVRENVQQYLNGVGFYTISQNLQVIGFYSTPINDQPSNPNIEILMVPSPSFNNYTKTFLDLTQDTFDALFEKSNGLNTFVLYIILQHPKSSGTIRLKSRNPYEYPLIDTNFLSDRQNHDINTLYSMIDVLKKLENTQAFKSMKATRRPIDLPACRAFKYDTRDYWHCIIRQMTFHIFHPVGTAKMGPANDCTAVVNQRFQVHGLQALRVVDASVLPFPLSGHPAATCMMFGERAADFIKEDAYQ